MPRAGHLSAHCPGHVPTRSAERAARTTGRTKVPCFAVDRSLLRADRPIMPPNRGSVNRIALHHYVTKCGSRLLLPLLLSSLPVVEAAVSSSALICCTVSLMCTAVMRRDMLRRGSCPAMSDINSVRTFRRSLEDVQGKPKVETGWAAANRCATAAFRVCSSVRADTAKTKSLAGAGSGPRQSHQARSVNDVAQARHSRRPALLSMPQPPLTLTLTPTLTRAPEVGVDADGVLRADQGARHRQLR